MKFEFLNPGPLSDDQLSLHLSTTESADQSIWYAPTYRFEIRLSSTNQRIGHINLRVGDSERLIHGAGHIGYGIDEPHRGHHFAEKACRLLIPFAIRNGMQTLWITTNIDNRASQRTLERLGATYIETVDLPEDYPMPPGAIRKKCRYKIQPQAGVWIT